ncbi:MAG TPA: hypothetical protein VMS86_07320, partial [Thermoanaerobaculia bacterium]|nr:hypothetical protein [Thermoanaerobaculia bacterium]
MMAKRIVATLGAISLSLVAFASDNPPAEGFDAAGSDAKAIELADRVMQAMGGRPAWDATRYIGWKFFAPQPAGRTHLWDKWTGNLRYQHGDQITLMNIHTKDGSAWKAGQKVEDPAELRKLLQQGYEAWVNDCYWLLMPYKLKDTGVTLKYKGEGATEDGKPADMLQLTFEDVGVTPENKYDVWVDKESGLVTQWAYYPTAADEAPRFKTPWASWTRHGGILLSGDRGQMQLTEIAVYDQV